MTSDVSTQVMTDSQEAEAPDVRSVVEVAEAETSRQPGGGFAHRLMRFVVGAWKYLVGVILCGGLVSSVLVVGWTYALMQRVTVKRWFKSAATGDDSSFEAFVDGDSYLARHRRWPNWLVASGFRERFREAVGKPGIIAKVRTVLGVVSGALIENAKIGFQAMVNTWALTLPGCALWLFAWYAGWNNSFHKGYELAWIGPTTGLAGVAVFILAMLYVPIAQARQASTGQWRSFYDFRLLRRVMRKRWLACVGLAGMYALCSLPVVILKTAPMLFDRSAGYALMTDGELFVMLRRYFFFAAAGVFPLYVFLKIMAARIYAAGLLEAVQEGEVDPEALGTVERSVLGRLGLLRTIDRPRRHAVVRVSLGLGETMLRWTAVAGAVTLWFTFVAEVFVSEFLNYHPVIGWLNQPLVQLPFFRYIPGGLGG